MKVLLVEDNRKLASSLQKLLKIENFEVEVAHDGEVGLSLALENIYDIVLLDVGLPKISGFDVCNELRTAKINTPILMLTARDATDDKILGFDYGADDYVVKPFDFDELLARVRALIRRSTGQATNVLTVEDIILDMEQRLVVRSSQEISLSPKEYTLLEYFKRRPNQVIPKYAALEYVWGEEVSLSSNVIDVYVGYLRKKIDKPFPNKPQLIHTIKGSGYRFGRLA